MVIDEKKTDIYTSIVTDVLFVVVANMCAFDLKRIIITDNRD